MQIYSVFRLEDNIVKDYYLTEDLNKIKIFISSKHLDLEYPLDSEWFVVATDDFDSKEFELYETEVIFGESDYYGNEIVSDIILNKIESSDE